MRRETSILHCSIPKEVASKGLLLDFCCHDISFPNILMRGFQWFRRLLALPNTK